MPNTLHDEGMYLLEMDDTGSLIWTTRYYEKDEEKGMQDVNGLIKAFDGLFNQEPDKKYSILIDVSPVYNQAFYLPKSAKQTFSKLIKKSNIKKLAILGANAYLTIVVEMLSRFTETWSKVRIFRDKHEALHWLKDD